MAYQQQALPTPTQTTTLVRHPCQSTFPPRFAPKPLTRRNLRQILLPRLAVQRAAVFLGESAAGKSQFFFGPVAGKTHALVDDQGVAPHRAQHHPEGQAQTFLAIQLHGYAELDSGETQTLQEGITERGQDT